MFIANSLPGRAAADEAVRRWGDEAMRRRRSDEAVVNEHRVRPVPEVRLWWSVRGSGRRAAGAAYVEQQARVGGARDGRRSTAMREWSASASRPAVLSRMASASSLKARSMLMLAFADVSMNRMLCSRAICAHRATSGLSITIKPLGRIC